MAVVPANGLVLVTGANGHLASVMTKVLLEHGYRVRGTVRSVAKHKDLVSLLGSNFSLAEVPDYSSPGAFDEAMIGVDGAIHMAADVSFTVDEKIIDEAVQGITNILTAASNNPSVRRVVLTSARAAAMSEKPGVPYKLDHDSWNTEAIEELKKPAETQDPQRRGMFVYSVAKLQAERAAFEFMEKHKPGFVFNSVLPNVNIGRAVAIEHLGFPSGSSLINTLDKGYPLGPAILPNQWFVNTDDMALLHLAALTLEDVQNERIFAMAGPYAWKELIEILNRRFPQRENIVKSCDGGPVDIGEVDNAREAELLRTMGRDGFKSLEGSLIDAMECVIAADELPHVPRTIADDFVDMIFKGKGQ